MLARPLSSSGSRVRPAPSLRLEPEPEPEPEEVEKSEEVAGGENGAAPTRKAVSAMSADEDLDGGDDT